MSLNYSNNLLLSYAHGFVVAMKFGLQFLTGAKVLQVTYDKDRKNSTFKITDGCHWTDRVYIENAAILGSWNEIKRSDVFFTIHVVSYEKLSDGYMKINECVLLGKAEFPVATLTKNEYVE